MALQGGHKRMAPYSIKIRLYGISLFQKKTYISPGKTTKSCFEQGLHSKSAENCKKRSYFKAIGGPFFSNHPVNS